MSSFFGGVIYDKNALNHVRETSWEGWRATAPVADLDEYFPSVIQEMTDSAAEDQGHKNACPGYGGTTAAEVAILQASGGSDRTPLSPMFSYVVSQEFDGRIGYDNGATMPGLRKAMTQIGHVELSAYPTRGDSYYIPPNAEFAAMKTAAASRIIKSTSIINTYDDLVGYLKRFGPVVWGHRWLRMFTNLDRDVFDGWDAADVGMHCTAVTGWSKRKDQRGRSYVKVNCSWGEWGVDGVAEYSPTLVENLLKDKYTVAFGVSMRGPHDPRPIDMLNYKRSRKEVSK